MTNQTFIDKCAQKLRNGETITGRHGNLFARGDTVYSYGYHYPLLQRIACPNGRTILVCNTAGYSVSTAKHIAMARGHANVCIDYELHRVSPFGATITFNTVLEFARNARNRLVEQAAAKRPGTKVRQTLERQRDNAAAAYERLAIENTTLNAIAY